MPKRVKYSIGDVFLIPLNDDLYGVGRVIVRDNDSCLFEFYQVEPLRSHKEIVVEEIRNLPSVLTRWAFDDCLKSGTWPIVGNVPVGEDFVYPNFWTKSVDNKYYLIPGTNMQLGDTERIKEISEEETQYAQRYGIMSPESTPRQYIRALQNSEK